MGGNSLKNSKKQDKLTFFLKNKKGLLISLVALVGAYICIYLSFKGNGFITAGVNLEKKDWLSFLGAYLAFAGTIIVSIVATLQTKHFAEIEKDKAIESRKKELQPIFSINIDGLNQQISGTAEVFNLYDTSTYPKHKNVTISLENVSIYPILNVIIFDKYLFQLLKPNERKTIQVAYSNSPDVQKWKEHIIEIQESDYESTEDGIPKWFNINYDDIDGNEMFQTFALKTFDDTNYYSLEGTHDKAVMAAYGFSTKMTETDCVGELMKLYQKMQ